MTDSPADTSHPPDICLILHSHAEQRWLISEVVPVVRALERPGETPEEQLGAALAYLEVLWVDARRRAAHTDAARGLLDGTPQEDCDRVLLEKAHRYHAAVRRLRGAIGRRVAGLTGLREPSPTHEHAGS